MLPEHTVTPSVPPPETATGYKGSHPIAAFFHIVFKLLAYLIFLLSVIGIINSFIAVFITVTLLLAADFWAVKNVTGRLLVSLRWWNDVREDGSNQWIYESGVGDQGVSPYDATFFWVTTYGNCAVWGLFAFFSLTSLSKLPLCIIALVLGISNAFGYTKCRKDARKKISEFLVRAAVDRPDVVAGGVRSAAMAA